MKTKALQRLEELNQILTSNKDMFKAGNVIPRSKLAKMFGLAITTKGSYANVHRSNLKLVRLQASLNRLLAHSGLCIRSKNYYTEFVVSDEETLKSVIKKSCASVDRATDKWITLETSYVERKERGNWGKYNKVKSKDVKAMADRQLSFRLLTTQKRVENY